MKKIYLLLALIAAMAIHACQDDDQKITPSEITNLSAQPCEGGIILRWDVPADSNYLYVRVNYTHPVTGQRMKRNASIYVDSVLIDGLFAKDGEYHFTLSPISTTETPGKESKISSTALPVQPVIKKQAEKIDLPAENLSTNAQEPSEGPIANLVNGNYKDFFHSRWNGPGAGPHWIDIALPEPLETFEIVTWYRNGARNSAAPYIIMILGSNDGQSWTEIEEVIDDGTGKDTDRYTTPVLGEEGKPYSYLRYRVDETVGNTIYFNAAEMEVNKVWYDIYDPEGIYQPED